MQYAIYGPRPNYPNGYQHIETATTETDATDRTRHLQQDTEQDHCYIPYPDDETPFRYAWRLKTA